MLGPLLLLISIHDLDDDLSSKVLKFADDTKAFRTVKTDADKDTLRVSQNQVSQMV